jgi:hypothetical protein
MDAGMTLSQVATGFLGSAEFQHLHGAHPDSGELVTRLYAQALHRAPDASSYACWEAPLTQGTLTRAQVLTGISDSPEHQATLLGVMQDGMAYLPV